MSGQYHEEWSAQMTQQRFVLANWIGRLTARLDDLVKYEKSVEFTLSDYGGEAN